MRRVLRAVEIESCQRHKPPLSLRLVRANTPAVGKHGVCEDAIWRVRTQGAADRYMRLYRGAESLRQLLSKYGWRDRRGCTYSANGAAMRTASAVAASVDDLGGGLSRDVAEALQALPPRRVRRLYAATLPPPGAHVIPCEDAVNVIGLPQRSVNSGVCWFGSLLWLLRMPPRVRAIVDAAIASSDRPVAAELRRRLPRVLTHPQDGYELHAALYRLHSIGDAIGIPPEEEGQNGYTQLMMLCTVLNLPALTLVADSSGRLRDLSAMPLQSKHTTMPPPRRPKHSDKALLGVRVMRDEWKPPLRMRRNGKTWHLQGAFLGSELCGHQTALSCGCQKGSFTHYDSDLARLGVGPYSFVLRGADWFDRLSDAFVFSNATPETKFCYFAPHNNHVLELTNGLLHASGSPHKLHVDSQTRGLARSLNVDWIYACD